MILLRRTGSWREVAFRDCIGNVKKVVPVKVYGPPLLLHDDATLDLLPMEDDPDNPGNALAFIERERKRYETTITTRHL